jgi:hypothetical protein
VAAKHPEFEYALDRLAPQLDAAVDGKAPREVVEEA